MAIWAVTGGGGAPGVTTLAMSLARTLHENGRRAALVDLDPDGGVVALRAGVPSDPGIFLLLDPVRGVTPQPGEIFDMARQTEEGWVAIPGFTHSGQAHQVSPVSGSELLRTLAQQFDEVVVDAGRSRPGLPGWMINTADHALWVADPSREGIVRLATALGGAVADRGLPGFVVINHCTRKDAVADVAVGIEQMWGVKVVSFCPDLTGDPRTSPAMTFACAQLISVMAPGLVIRTPPVSKRRWHA